MPAQGGHGHVDGVQGFLISQLEGKSASATTAYTATLNTEVTKILVCNITGSAATYRIFHADDAQEYTAGCALYYDVSLAANTTVALDAVTPSGGIALKIGGTLGVQSDPQPGITFSIYGVTETLYQ